MKTPNIEAQAESQVPATGAPNTLSATPSAEEIISQHTRAELVNEPTTAPVAPATPSVAGPDQAFAQQRRELEQAKADLAAAQAQLNNPQIAQFIEFQKAQQAQQAAAAQASGGVPQELIDQISSIAQTQQAQQDAAQLATARNEFASFAKAQGMDENIQSEFLGYLTNSLPKELQDLAVKPGFNFEPYIHGFAAQRGAKVAQQKAQVTYVPGQPSDGGAPAQSNEYKELIKNLVQSY